MNKYMREALKEAQKAARKGEVPVGVVIVRNDKIIGRGHNLVETKKDPTAHGEIIAIKEATKSLGGWRLVGATMYATLEPCPMCAGAIVAARIEKLVIGTMDKKGGGCGSVLNITAESKLNHQVDIEVGMLQDECQKELKDFFKNIREKKRGK